MIERYGYEKASIGVVAMVGGKNKTRDPQRHAGTVPRRAAEYRSFGGDSMNHDRHWIEPLSGLHGPEVESLQRGEVVTLRVSEPWWSFAGCWSSTRDLRKDGGAWASETRSRQPCRWAKRALF